MQKEIFEQPESIMNTMRGRVNFETSQGILLLLFAGCLFNCCVAGFSETRGSG